MTANSLLMKGNKTEQKENINKSNSFIATLLMATYNYHKWWAAVQWDPDWADKDSFRNVMLESSKFVHVHKKNI